MSFLGRLAVGVPALRQAAAGLFSKKLLRQDMFCFLFCL